MSVLKTGYIKRYSKNMFNSGWGNCWVVLYQDSYLLLYKKQGDTDPKAKINMKEVCKHFAIGEHVSRNFSQMPHLPGGASMTCAMAIPEKPSHKAKVHFLLFNSEQDLHEWMTAITSVLPTRQTKSVEQPIQVSSTAPVSGAPPGYMPGPPPPGGIGFNVGPPPPGQYPQQPYPQQPGPYPPQPYPQQPGPYPQQPGMYPQQPGPYPQQPAPGYAPPPYSAQPGYPQQGYGPPQGVYGYQQPPPQQYGGYQQQQQPNVVYVQQGGKSHKGGGMGSMLSGNKGKMAAGLIGGAALGYGASRMMGGGFGGGFGGFGMGRCGSWSSLSSWGSCGSFGSFGSFD